MYKSLSIVFIAATCAVSAPGDTNTNVVAEAVNQIPPALADTNLVAVVNGEPIPYEWLLHEFRSTFFRYNDAADSRDQVLDSLIERVLLYQAALKAGVADDSETAAEIDERISSMRAFMNYRIEMARLSMIVDKLLETKKLSPADFETTEEDLQAFFDKEIKGKPGAPDTVEGIPDRIKEQITTRIQQMKQSEAIQAFAKELRKSAEVQINRQAVDSVPKPEMKGMPGGSVAPR